MAKRLTPEEEARIVEMIEQGDSIGEIIKKTGRSKSTIQGLRIKAGLNCTPQDNTEKLRWLEKNWHFKKPVKQKVKKRRSNFRTPYHP